jgi:hypothetical protein
VTLKSYRSSSSNLVVPRFFTLFQAEGTLPEVENLLRKLIQLKEDYQNSERELNLVAQRITMAGGMIAPRERVGELRSQKDAAARGLQATVERIQAIGCQLKDVDVGLIDFPTLYRDKEVYLCWKLGESGIGFWHEVEDGFGGRRPIDSDFLANHRGEES